MMTQGTIRRFAEIVGAASAEIMRIAARLGEIEEGETTTESTAETATLIAAYAAQKVRIKSAVAVAP